jgi:hypothetical protein
MWLSWRWGLAGTIVFAVAFVALRPSDDRRAKALVVWLRELALMFGLYTLWQIAARLSVMHLDGALDRGRTVRDVERWLHLPSELWAQHQVLGHKWLVQFANLYYAIAHAPALGIFIVWLFVRHRHQYPAIRTTLALTTFVCLAVQLVPVAPPRLLPEFGFVDTARLYGQSVYAATVGSGSFDQLSAMPSVHVAWAAVVGWFTVRVSSSPWRWIAAVHLALTVFAITVTANHWLADGIVSVVMMAAQRMVRRLRIGEIAVETASPVSV